MRYILTLKSGLSMEVTQRDTGKSAIGLWVWSLRQRNPQVMHFKEISVLATEVTAIQELEEFEPPLAQWEEKDFHEL